MQFLKKALVTPRLDISTAAGTFSTYMHGVIFGTGSTPPTLNDLYLSEPIKSGLSFVSPSSHAAVPTSNGPGYEVTYAITNTTSKDIAISEIMTILGGCPFNYMRLPVDRTVLDAPVVIPANSSKQVTYKIEFPYP